MRVELGSYGVWRRVAEITPELARSAEELGYGAIWVGGSPAGHLEEVEVVLASTERIPVATGIVNMWREDPGLVAASYHRIEDRFPNRFLLGLGIGHPEATREYRRPYDTMVEYLDRVEAEGVPTERLLLAALGPRALELAAERTAGAHPYLTTPAHTAFAREVMGAGPLLAPEHKVVLRPDHIEELARPNVSRYLKLVNYRTNLLREGWSEVDLAEGGSDALVEALVLGGEVPAVVARLQAHLEAGADHVCIQVLGPDPTDSYRILAQQMWGESSG